MKYIYFLLLMSVFACSTDDQYQYIPSDTDNDLEQRLQELYGSNDALLLPPSGSYNEIENDPKNPITSAKVALGKLLFHETGLAQKPYEEIGRGTYSCASCHQAKAGFQSGLKQSIGEGGTGFGLHGEGRSFSTEYLQEDIDVQPIRSPPILNVAYQDVMLWSGQFGGVGTNAGTEESWTSGTPKENNLLGFEGVETQAIAGVSVHRQEMTEDLLDSGYRELFDSAFPDLPVENRYTHITIGMAVAAYERSVLSNEAPFQLWLKGDDGAMSAREKEGAEIFFGKADCYECHSGPALNSMAFYALGMDDLQGDGIFLEVDDATRKGRGGYTGDPSDNFKFKTPQLYNLRDHEYFGHGGSFGSVREVVEYKNRALAENTDVPPSQLSERFVPLDLTEDEIDLVTLFLEKSLYDPNLQRYVPDMLPSGNCFPNADDRFKMESGCGG